MKYSNLFLIFFIVFLFAFPFSVTADKFIPLVRCGGAGQDSCTLCDLFALFNRLIGFILLRIVPILAVLMIVAGGGMFMMSGGSPQTISNAKALMQAAVIGLVLIYAAWFIVGLFLQLIGLAQVSQFQSWWESGFFTITCNK